MSTIGRQAAYGGGADVCDMQGAGTQSVADACRFDREPLVPCFVVLDEHDVALLDLADGDGT